MDIDIFLIISMRFDPEGLDFDFRHGTAHTSRLEKVEYEEISLGCYKITATTQNSTYVYQFGELTDKKPLTKEEKQAFALACMF